MPEKYRRAVWGKAGEFYRDYFEELKAQLLEGAPDPERIRDMEARREAEEFRRRRVEFARNEAKVEALLSAIAEVGATAGFWFAGQASSREPLGGGGGCRALTSLGVGAC